MNIVLLTPGTGSYHCGVCMRDNALAKELHRQGHRALLLPMYLPLTLDEDAASPGTPIFFGGLSTYLREKFPLLRRMPRWLDRLLSARWILKILAGHAGGKTGGPEVAEMTLSMLRGEHGNQAGELRELIVWLKAAFDGAPPDAVWLSTALQAGLARSLREELNVPIVGFLQGEDTFLDGLGSRAEEVWSLLSERMKDANVWVAPSRYFAELMAARLRWSAAEMERGMRVMPNGIALEDFEGEPEAPRSPVTIGYLARFVPGKGIGVLVDAFIILKKRNTITGLRLRCAGSMTDGDARYVETLKAKLAVAGCAGDVEFLPNVSREEKVRFLRSLDVFSVPAVASEAFGLYVIEALAAGVPVVQPRAWAFPEIVTETCGVLFEPGTNAESAAVALADALGKILGEPARLRALGAGAKEVAQEKFSLRAMAASFVRLAESVGARPAEKI
ncbi:MAG: glycosyltransferase family 4 protein [Chthoniobacteraceae bacterium]